MLIGLDYSVVYLVKIRGAEGNPITSWIQTGKILSTEVLSYTWNVDESDTVTATWYDTSGGEWTPFVWTM